MNVLETKIYPPIEGFTHQDIIDEVGNRVYQDFLQCGVEAVLAKETVFSFSALFLEELRKRTAEHIIAKFVSQPDLDIKVKVDSIQGLANDYSILLIDTAVLGIAQSPVAKILSQDTLTKIINSAADYLYNKIIQLKKRL